MHTLFIGKRPTTQLPSSTMEFHALDTNTKHSPRRPTCSHPSCFLCIMTEIDPSVRKVKIARCFKEMPLTDDKEHVLALSGLWKIAMAKPNDPEFPSLGLFECMAKLILRGITDKAWLLRHQNIYIPYYAAHIIGSYTMNKSKFADTAVQSGVVFPLVELLKGRVSWVERRAAIRALGHLASHKKTFEAVAVYESEIIKEAMKIASTCLDEVYINFVSMKKSQRLKYQRNLLTRSLGGLEFENRKVEEWASQLQCWSLYMLDCFACKAKSLELICEKEFLNNLCGMWGGLANRSSPAGIGLMRTLCHSKTGRRSVANLQVVLESLCNLSRSSDDWQDMAIDCLLLLLKDPEVRYRVIGTAAPALVDLAELRNIKGKTKVGQTITQTLLQDYHKIRYCNFNLESQRAQRALEELWELKVERRKKESLTTKQEMKERSVLAGLLKLEGNRKFWSGDVKNAVMKYTEALDFCPLSNTKERIVLHSNRAQCHLMMRDAEAAISDSTRSLCLSSARSLHSKSLWRRAQAYDMKGLARQSLMDTLTFIHSRDESKKTKRLKIPNYAARMINKQMNATWVFVSSQAKRFKLDKEVQELNGQWPRQSRRSKD